MREDLIKRMQQGYKFGDSDVILEAVEEIESLRQQLDGWIAANSPNGWIDNLRQQLTAALAACKSKDELIRMCAGIQVGYLKEALAIQPDDSALQAFAEKVLEQCAVAAWLHYMEVCKKHGHGPDVQSLRDFCSATAIRNLKELPK